MTCDQRCGDGQTNQGADFQAEGRSRTSTLSVRSVDYLSNNETNENRRRGEEDNG